MNKRKMSLMLIIMLILLIPSTISAAEVEKKILSITYSNKKYSYANGEYGTVKGTMEEPVKFDLGFDEIVVNYGSDGTDKDKIEYPFYFELLPGSSGMKYGKYLVTLIETEKKVVFKRLEATNNIDDLLVIPDKKTTLENFLQPGGVYNPAYDYTLFAPPLYKIESHFHFNIGTSWLDDTVYKIETVLGNSTLKSSDKAEDDDATNTKVFVFACNNLPESQCVKFAPTQQGDAVVTVKTVDDGWGIDNEKVKTFQSTGATSLQEIATGGTTYTFDGKTGRVVYAFWGLTSLILNDNEPNEIEEIVTKLLLSIGGMFRAIVTAVGGKDLTIDALIFNTYQKTMLDFWGENGTYTDVFKTIINGWFTAFKTFASVILVIVLVAMGVKALLYAGTAKEKKIQNMLVGWVLAVGLMYIGPYFMKYAVAINDAFVKTIRAQSKYSVYSVYNADFLNEYGLETDMQIGEDSETVKLLDTLRELYSKIEANLQDAEDRKAEAEQKIKNMRTQWTNRAKIADITIYDPTGGSLTFDKARKQVRTYALSTPGITVAEAEAYISEHIVTSVDIQSKDGWWNEVQNTVLNVLGHGSEEQKAKLIKELAEFAEATAAVEKYSNDLAATERAIELANKGIDLESQMKERAGETYRLVYVLVWYLMIYQLVLLLFLYYKRLVVVGVLITIFPLVVMMYAIEKLMGIDSSRTLKTWLTEFIVNVFIQAIHALLYIMLVEAGLKAFEEDPDNWLLFLFAVMAIFPMEQIVKSILGMKASSLSNLKDSSKKALGVSAAIAGTAASLGSSKKIDAKYNALDKAAAAKAAKQDKTANLIKSKLDNRDMKRAVGGASKADAMDRLAQRDQRKQALDATRAKKRAASQRIRDTRRRAEKVMQPLRNLSAISSVITTGLAGGGDAADFAVGRAVASTISGKNRKVKNAPGGANTANKTVDGQAKNRYQNSRGNQGAGNGQQGGGASKTSQGHSKPGQPASAPDYGNGRTTQTLGEKRASDRKARHSAELQNKVRERLANMQVNSGTPFYEVSEDTSNSVED